MKVTEVESFLVGNAHFVRIHTDTGLTGLGQSACWGYPAAVDTLVRTLANNILDEDPLRIEHLWQQLYRIGPFRGAVLSGAVSAVDIALWDIKGKYYEAPIWQLLGGRCRDRVRLCLLILGISTPDDIWQAVHDARGEGYSAIKFDPLPPGYPDMAVRELVTAVSDRVASAREAAGESVDVVIEFHRSLSPLQALPVIKALQQFHPLFMEDPIQIDSISSQADIARRFPVAIGLGERLHSIWEFREQLEQAGPIYLRADIGLAGGITHCKKIAAIAEAYHTSPMWHNWLGPVITAASTHLDVSIPNFLVQEFYAPADEGDAASYLTTTLHRDGGYLLPPETPGLGVELDQEKMPADDSQSSLLTRIPLRADGSVSWSV